jgi:divalent anion:Na+ symporter, DASS family
MIKILQYLIPALIGLSIYLLPCPQDLDPKGWHLLAIFAATITSLITKPLPMGGVALVSLTVVTLTGTISEKDAFSGFASSVSWLIVLVFFVARAFIKSGAGKRIAYLFILLFGRNALGLAYSLVITDLFIAPFMPSSAARAGGIIYPIFRSITDSVDSLPGKTALRLGAFLTQVCFHSNYITNAMFLTAVASNPMIQSFAKAQNINITWGTWALAAIIPGLLSLIIIPLIIYLVYPPELKQIRNSAEFAKENLHKIGKISNPEKIMLATFMLMLVLWIGGEQYGIGITTTGLLGVSLLLLTKIITLEDILSEHEAWHTLLWFSILIMLSQQLQLTGVVDWFSKLLGERLTYLSWAWGLVAIILVYFYSHYLFASITSHVSAMYPAFLGLAITAGTPPLLAALALGFASNIFASLTHYGSTGAVIFSGPGFVPIRTWWLIGLLASVINLMIWGVIGGGWWKFLGIW